MANKPLQSIQFPGLPDKYTVPQMDSNFDGVSGKIPDSKKVHDEIDALKEDLKTISSGDKVDIISKATITGTVLLNGTNNSASQYVRSDYIPIVKGQNIECVAMQAPTTAAILSFYNEAKVCITSLSVAGLGSTTNAYARVTVGQNGYIRISTKSATIGSAHCYLCSVSAQNAEGLSALEKAVISTGLYAAEPKTYKTNGDVLFTAETMPPKHICYYSITSTPRAAYIGLFDANDTEIATLGSTSSTESGRTDSGSFVVPDSFSYAKVLMNGADGALTVNYLYADNSIPKEIEALKKPKSANIIISRIMRFLDAYSQDQQTRRLGLQGITYLNGIYWTSGNIDSESENQTICAWDATTSALISCTRFTQLLHANDIAGINGQLLVVCGDLNIAVLDIAQDNTVTLNRKINTDSVFSQSAYAISVFGGKIYILGHHISDSNLLSIASLDLSTDELVVLQSFSKFASVKPQGMAVRYPTAYILYNRSNVLYAVDMISGEKTDNFFIPSHDANIATGELEAPLVMDGNIYLFGALYYNNYVKGVQQEVAIGQLFRTNILNKMEAREVFSYMDGVSPINVTVDNRRSLTSNPIQFVTTVEEACAIVGTHGGGTINVAYADSGVAELFDGKYSIISDDSEHQNRISVLVAYNADVIVSHVDIGQLIAVNSRVTLIDCTVTTTESSNSVVT